MHGDVEEDKDKRSAGRLSLASRGPRAVKEAGGSAG